MSDEKHSTGRPFDVLIVEDDQVDRLLVERAFKLAGSNVRTKFREDGISALKLLNEMDDNGNLYRPDACLCDINMPGMSGIDLLRKLKAEETLQCIPITMLSSSDDERDIRTCYQSGAASYLCKPHNYQDLCTVIDGYSKYWINTVSLPMRINLGDDEARHH
ncbi:MAG: response regulator [Marinomonas sp.]